MKGRALTGPLIEKEKKMVEDDRKECGVIMKVKDETGCEHRREWKMNAEYHVMQTRMCNAVPSPYQLLYKGLARLGLK